MASKAASGKRAAPKPRVVNGDASQAGVAVKHLQQFVDRDAGTLEASENADTALQTAIAMAYPGGLGDFRHALTEVTGSPMGLSGTTLYDPPRSKVPNMSPAKGYLPRLAALLHSDDKAMDAVLDTLHYTQAAARHDYAAHAAASLPTQEQVESVADVLQGVMAKSEQYFDKVHANTPELIMQGSVPSLLLQVRKDRSVRQRPYVLAHARQYIVAKAALTLARALWHALQGMQSVQAEATQGRADLAAAVRAGARLSEDRLSLLRRVDAALVSILDMDLGTADEDMVLHLAAQLGGQMDELADLDDALRDEADVKGGYASAEDEEDEADETDEDLAGGAAAGSGEGARGAIVAKSPARARKSRARYAPL